VAYLPELGNGDKPPLQGDSQWIASAQYNCLSAFLGDLRSVFSSRNRDQHECVPNTGVVPTRHQNIQTGNIDSGAGSTSPLTALVCE